MKAIKSTKTKTEMLDLGNSMLCMEICKGTVTILVVQSHEFIVVVDRYLTTSTNEPFVKLAKAFNSPEKAYDEWTHVVGKMCKKECTSKYFDKPKLDEHMKNGKFPRHLEGIIIDIARTAVRLVNSNTYRY